MARDDWEVVRLGDKVQCNPQTKLNKWEEYDFLPMENIKSWCYKFPVWYNKKINNSWWAKFQNWDTVFARITPCLQNWKICKIQWIEKWFGSTEYFVFRAIEWVTKSDYVFYLMCHPYIRDLAEKSMIWASWRQRANVIVIENLEISLPPLAEQQRIASILSAYDDLIENNTRRIVLLEQMAQTLYRQWFVAYKFPWHQDVEMVDSGTEFGMIPQGWEVKKIGEVWKVITWKTPSKEKKEFYDGDFLFIKTPDIHGNIYILETQDRLSQEWYNSQINKTIPKNSICISCIWTVWAVCITSQDSQTNQQINSIVPRNDYDVEYLYLLCSNLKDKLEWLWSNGVTLTNVNKDKFEKIEILYPNLILLANFHTKIMPMFDDIINLQKQNQSLKEQRDLLLRKLIG